MKKRSLTIRKFFNYALIVSFVLFAPQIASANVQSIQSIVSVAIENVGQLQRNTQSALGNVLLNFSSGVSSLSEKISGQIANSTQSLVRTSVSLSGEISKNIGDVKELATDAVKTASKAVSETSSRTSTVVKNSFIDTNKKVTTQIVPAVQTTIATVGNSVTESTEKASQLASAQSASVTSALNDGLEKVYGFAIDKTANVLIPFFIRTESFQTPSLTIQNFSTTSPKEAQIQIENETSQKVQPQKPSALQPTVVVQQVPSNRVLPVVPRTTVNDILVQSILKRLTNLENRSVVTGPIQQFITNTYTGGVSYSVPADTTSYTNTTVNSAVNTAVTSLQEQINLVSSSASATNTFAFILATSTTATSTFSGNMNVGGDVEVGGNITATSFYGDGSNLTGITSFSTSTTRGVFSAGANLSYDSVNGIFSFASTTARGMLSSSATGLTYNNSTGDFSLTSGYNIPLTASTTEWASKVSSQWTTTGSDIYYTTGNVGVGTASPVNVFDIVKSDGTNPVTLNVQNTIGNTSGMAQLMLGTRTTVGDTQVGAKVKAQRTDTGSAGTTDLSFSVSSGTTMTERMRIMGNGNIGIGTSSPAYQLEITGDFNTSAGTIKTAGTTRITNSGGFQGSVGNVSAPGFSFSVDTNTGLYRPVADNLGFVVGGAEALRIDSSGNVGIGTTTPTARLSVYTPNGTATNQQFSIGNGGEATYYMGRDGNVNGRLYFTGGIAGQSGYDFNGPLYSNGSQLISQGVSGIMVGNVNGIAAPNTGLRLAGSSDGSVDYTMARNGSTGALEFNGTQGGGNTFYTFSNSSTELFRINGNGNVGIGTTTPGYTLTVAGDTNITGALRFAGDSGTSGYVLQSTATGAQWVATSSLGISGGSSFSTSTTRGVLSSSATGLTYNNSTGDFSLTSGYNIPLTASTTEWASKVSSQWTTTGSDIYYTTGNVGVGTTTPGYGLVVSGNSDTLAKGPLYIASTNANTYGTGFNLDATAAGGRNYSITAGGSSAYNPNGWAVYDSSSSTYRLSINASGYTTVGAITAPSGSSASQLGVRGNTSIGSTYFQTAAPTNGLLVEGNVGIGTTTPGSALTVAGTTTVSGILHLPNVSIIRSSTDNVLIASSSMGTIFLGGAGSTTSSGSYSIGIGSSALANVSSSGAYNIGIGYRAGTAITSAARNISIGANAGDANQASPDNVAIGYDALTAMNGTSIANTAVGNYALSGLTTNSHYNVALGMKAGSTLTSGVGNIIIGSGNNGDGVSTPSTTSSNTLNIGGVLWGTGMNSVTGSSIAAGNIGIGTSTPVARLAIAGASGASTDLLRVASSTGSPLFAISSAGKVGIGSEPNSLYTVSITGGLLITGSASAFGAGAIGMSGNALTFAGGSSGYEFRSSANSAQMSLSSGGNLGIGTTTPSAKLAITGTAGTSDIFNIASSTNASLFKIGSTGATYFNNDAGTAGYVLLSNGTGLSPTWVATSTLGISGGGGSSQWTTTGSDIYYDTGRVAIGQSTVGATYGLEVNGKASTTQLYLPNTASASIGGIYFGSTKFIHNYGTRNTFVGSDAGNLSTTGIDNASFGYQSLQSTSGSKNVGMGVYALQASTGSYNIGIGFAAQYNANSGSYNVSMGDYTLVSGNGSYNVAIGTNALRNVSTGSSNSVAIGASAGYAATGANNIFLGYQAGNNLTTGTNNIIIGYDIDATSIAMTQGLNIGNLIFGTGLNGTATTLSTGNIGIGTTTPSAKLAVTGTAGTSDIFNIASSTNASLFKIASTGATYFNNDAGTAGYVLLSNGTGLSPTWVATSTLGISGGGGSSQWTTTGSDIYYDTGNVGIGSASDGYKLQVYDLSGGDIAVFGADAEKNLKISWNGINTYYQGDPSPLSLNANGGNVGIGTTTPVSKLDVVGDINISSGSGIKMNGSMLMYASSTNFGTVLGIGAGGRIPSDASQTYNTAIGYQSLATSTGTYGTAVGWRALYSNTLGSSNTAIGVGAFSGITSGSNNVGIGAFAGYNTNGGATDNTAIGHGALNTNGNTLGNRNTSIGAKGGGSFIQSGSGNIDIGAYVMRPVSTGSGQLNIGNVLYGTGMYDTAVQSSTYTGGRIGIGTSTPIAIFTIQGTSSNPTTDLFNIASSTGTSLFAVNANGNLTLPVTTSGGLGIINMGSSRFIHGYGATQTNVFIGPSAGNLTNTGRDAIGIGSNALVGLTSARLAVAIGSGALERNSSGWSNTAIGESSLNFVTTNGNNTAVGRRALYGTTGANNTAIGTQAGESASSGSDNIYIGYLAGDNLTTGSTNIIIGTNIDFASTTASNQLNIGNLIFSQGITGTGTTLSTGNIGIGTSTPGQKLTVVGTIQSTDLLGGSTNLTVDASGNIIRDPSDQALKENVVTLEGSLAKIEQLRGVRYEWKDKLRFGSSSEIGVIAQEVELVVPEVVSSGGLYKSVNIKNLVALLIEGVKELKVQVDAVKDKVVAISAWFGTDGDRFNVKGMVCVDDVCVTKDQFKQLLINSGSASVISSPPAQNTPPSTGDTSIEENNTSTSTTQSSGGSETPVQSTSNPLVETDNDPSPSPAAENAPTPAPESTPEPETTPALAPTPEPAPAPAPTE